MSDYTWPSNVDPATAAISWLDNTAVFKSPLSGTTRTESRPGGRWHLSLTVTGLMNKEQPSNPLHELEAFLFKLNGKTNRAIVPDFAYRRSGPGGDGSQYVHGSSQTGSSLITNGWPLEVTTVLYAGDRIGLTTGQMCVVAADVESEISGIATIPLATPIRISPVGNSAVEIDAPTATYILANKASFASKPGIAKTVLIEFEEAIP